MKDSNILAGNVTIKQYQKDNLLNNMKESNILVDNATIKQHPNEILLNTKGQHMKEFDSIADIVINNIFLGQILQSTKKIYIFKNMCIELIL